MNSLTPLHFQTLPLGAIRPRGWLAAQLRIQADGLTGHLDEFWPSVADSRWIGGDSEGWERGPYWLDGLIPLAFLLDDERLKSKARHWVNHILAEQHEDGWLGAKADAHEGLGESELDPWPLFVLFKAFLQWHCATRDERIVPSLLRCARRVERLLGEKPLEVWAKVRWMDWVWCLHGLHDLSGESWLLDAAATAQSQGFDWREFFQDYQHTEKTDVDGLDEGWKLPLHGVNNAMATKGGAVWARQSGEIADAQSSAHMIETLDKYHGHPTGMFSGDEHLAGRSPVQGTETCSIAEYLFSLEVLLTLNGQTRWADRIESLAFNALPVALDKQMWARQYDSQPNQIWCNRARRDWVSNGADSNIFSLEGNFGCCTANFHQAWPKFAAHAWLCNDKGLVAALLVPTQLETDWHGTPVRIETATDYPFAGAVTFQIEAESPVEFALQIRVPSWAKGATIEIEGATQNVAAGEFVSLRRPWTTQTVTLQLPLEVRAERRFNDAVALRRGALLLALPVDGEWEKLAEHSQESRAADWAINPVGPWNYALDLNESSFAATQSPIGRTPFAPDAAPLQVAVCARRLPNWTIENDSAAPPPQSPVQSDEPLETLALIPFGSTVLRISEFPVTD